MSGLQKDGNASQTPETEEYWVTGPKGGIQITATDAKDAIRAYMEWAHLYSSDRINAAVMIDLSLPRSRMEIPEEIRHATK